MPDFEFSFPLHNLSIFLCELHNFCRPRTVVDIFQKLCEGGTVSLYLTLDLRK